MGTLFTTAGAVSAPGNQAIPENNKMADDDAKQKEQLNAQLKEYISAWRETRAAEEDELQKLKEKQAKRKEIRAEQEKKLNQQKRDEEEKLKKEEAEKKAIEAEEKKKKAEEAEAKRQEMLEAQKQANPQQKSAAGGGDARKEIAKTKEQLEEEKKIALSIRIKPLALDAMDSDELRSKAEELFNIIVSLETDKYDYEQKRVNQEAELKELKERQKAQLRQKAMKKGLDPEAFVGKYPPMIRMYSKYERRTDTRTYEDRKKLYEGGWEVIRAESLDAIWKEKYEE